MPPRLTILIHRDSVRYARGVAEHARTMLEQVSGVRCDLSIVDRVEDAEIPEGGVAFLIGMRLPPFERQPGRTYVYLNLAALMPPSWHQGVNLRGRMWLAANRRAIESRLECFDRVLDYYPSQTAWLAQQLSGRGVRVQPYGVGALPQPAPAWVPLEARPYDVCIVGSLSPRRQRLHAALRERGISLSPHESDDLPATMTSSRLVLNVHMEPCDSLELPRIIQAIAIGGCVIAETTPGSDWLLPDDVWVQAGLGDLADSIQVLLADQGRIVDIGLAAARFYSGKWQSRCRRLWCEVLEDLGFGTAIVPGGVVLAS